MSAENHEQLLNDINQRFGAVLRQIRQEKSITQQDLADKSRLSLRMITALEAGDRKPSLTTLVKIAKGLDIGFRELIERLLKEMGV